MQKINVGIVGASGMIGATIFKLLMDDNLFVQANIYCFASTARSITIYDHVIELEQFSLEAVKKCHIVFLAVSGDFAKQYAKAIIKQGSLVIDNSSAWRYDEEVPLIVPEINLNSFDVNKHKLIANPNCTTILLNMVLWPIHLHYSIKKVLVSTYQAVSGAGYLGINELSEQTSQHLNNSIDKGYDTVFAHDIAFNVIPCIDTVQKNGYSREEMKVVWESRKIMNIPDLLISCTAVRVPVFRSHSETVIIETDQDVDINKVRKLLDNFPGVILMDDPVNNIYPMPLNTSEKTEVKVGRIRNNLIFANKGIELFLCGDQVLKGGAFNAVQIAKHYMKHIN